MNVQDVMTKGSRRVNAFQENLSHLQPFEELTMEIDFQIKNNK